MPNRPPIHKPLGQRVYRDPRLDHRARGTPQKPWHRLYDSRWERFRAAFLADNPWCVDCFMAGRTTPANEVHHVRRVRDYPELLLDPSNCMALCAGCHSIRTNRGE